MGMCRNQELIHVRDHPIKLSNLHHPWLHHPWVYMCDHPMGVLAGLPDTTYRLLRGCVQPGHPDRMCPGLGARVSSLGDG